jgi:hypothetical protein
MMIAKLASRQINSKIEIQRIVVVLTRWWSARVTFDGEDPIEKDLSNARRSRDRDDEEAEVEAQEEGEEGETS